MTTTLGSPSNYTRPLYLNLKQAARHFGVSERTVFNWRTMGFPVACIRGRRLVPLEKAEAWVNQHITIR
jgi:hypothetical protein